MAEQATLTRADLSEAVYLEAGVMRPDAATLVDLVLEEVSNGIIEDGIVKISSFGTFTVRDKRERMGRNPKTGKQVPISPRRVLAFRASTTLKSRITAGMQRMTSARRTEPGN